MKNIGFSKDEMDHIIDLTVAVLLMGNLHFETYSKSGVGDISTVAKTS